MDLRIADWKLSTALLFLGHGKTAGCTHCGRHGGRGPGRSRTTVVRHVCPDKMTGGERSAQTEFTGENRGCDDSRQLASIFTRGGRVRTANTEHVQHGGLCLQDGTTTNGAHLDGRHGHGDLEVAIVAIRDVSIMMFTR